MVCITEKQHKELISILTELITTIELMETEYKDYLLFQNKREAKEWLVFLKNHTDKEELKSLEDEISDRLFYRFDVQIVNTKLDDKRAELMKSYIIKSNEYLK